MVVIVFALHSPGSGGWPSCVVEHGEHQTQMGTKSHYFSAGSIMVQVGEEMHRHYPITIELSRHKKKRNVGNLIATLMGS